MSTSEAYVLLTAAKNEERFIEYALRSVVTQTVHPLAWFIVDDGSTDETSRIVQEYARRYSFIYLVSRAGSSQRCFSAQYRALNMAYELARPMDFGFLGVHDADIEVATSDYYERVLEAFSREPALGITGGAILERKGTHWNPRLANSPDSVAGAIQVFRRSCFDQIGGYSPLLFGGEDWLAQIEARRMGWLVAASRDLPAHHHRPTSTADGRLRGLFRLGKMDASFSSHPAFEVLKCARRVGEPPLVLGSLVRFAGYVSYLASMGAPLLPAPSSAYLRHEQLRRVCQLLPSAGESVRSALRAR